MRNAALYFPYIDVPESAWITRLLLYWDSVASIVPLDFAEAPDLHSPYMRDLVAAQLVTQLFPGQYIHKLPNFGSPFIDYIRARLDKPRHVRSRAQSARVLVHAEKTGNIGRELVDLGVATDTGYPWYEMERWVANAYMTYLATTLGSLAEVGAAPITQDRECFRLLSGPLPAGIHLYRSYQFLSPARAEARTVILRGVFPNPKLPATVSDLADFKARHGDKLRRLRNAVEYKCIEIAAEPNSEVRRERAQRICTLLRDEIAEASDAIRITWKQVAMGSVCAVLGAASGFATTSTDQKAIYASSLAGLAAAAYTALDPIRRRKDGLKRPLAYAALANIRFAPN